MTRTLEHPELDNNDPKSVPARPNSKITIETEIPSMGLRKNIRLLPTQTLSSFINKLKQKKIIEDVCGEITVAHFAQVMSGSEPRELPSVESERTLWELGVRDHVLLWFLTLIT